MNAPHTLSVPELGLTAAARALLGFLDRHGSLAAVIDAEGLVRYGTTAEMGKPEPAAEPATHMVLWYTAPVSLPWIRQEMADALRLLGWVWVRGEKLT